MGRSGEKLIITKLQDKVFRGQFKYSIDAKGRVAIPAKLRKHISKEANDTLIIKQGLSPCIELHPYDLYQEIEKKLLELNEFNPENARFLRMTSQYVTDDNLDAQSRILIPQTLLEYAGIKKEVLILGVLKRIELWNPEKYQEYLNQSAETYEQLAQKVMGG